MKNAAGILRGRLENIYKYRRLAAEMAVSQLKSKYSDFGLGIWIAVAHPLMVMLAISFVFTQIMRIEIKNFPLFALAGIFPWIFFSSALTEAAGAIVNQQALLRQFRVPREILPIALILAQFLNFLIGWCVMYPLFIIANPRALFLLPLVVFILALSLCFISGLGLMLAALNVIWRDVGQLLGISLMFWFWVTPVFYSVEMIPEKLRWICLVNPVTPYILFYREVLFGGNIPSLAVFAGVFFWTALSVTGSLAVFSALEAQLMKRV